MSSSALVDDIDGGVSGSAWGGGRRVGGGWGSTARRGPSAVWGGWGGAPSPLPQLLSELLSAIERDDMAVTSGFRKFLFEQVCMSLSQRWVGITAQDR